MVKVFKKKRVKKDFDAAIAEGDDARVQALLRENPWLQEYSEEEEDGTDATIRIICAAIGIMEDELQSPVPIDEILYSLEMDFNTAMERSQLEDSIMDLETKGYLKSEPQGLVLTVEGGRVCDNYLNKEASRLMSKLPDD